MATAMIPARLRHADRLPGLRQLPIRLARTRPQRILFESWHGRHSCNPRAIAEELRRRDAPHTQVWVLRDDSPVPEDATVVRPGSVEYLRELGRAEYVVANNVMPGYYAKRPSTTYLQTWHGTPLKRIGFDIERPRFENSDRYLRDLRREAASWDFLISPNGFSTEIFRRAFGFDGTVLETGYPRNDLLTSPDRDAIRSRVRAELRIPPEAVAVLYAPTWRDGSPFSLHLDLGELGRDLGERFVFLLRAHELDALRAGPASGYKDVSGWTEVGELYLAADVLITDYSSVMFDFAVTGKPILLFTYDLEAYRDDLRGFYFDLEREAPGPLLFDSAEVGAALADLDGVSGRYASPYEAFRSRFCQLEDGHAAQRVVDAVFAPDGSASAARR